uniref:Uncharacterized protein n=1 Tax=Anguilla anguilla TaxID=7936 RepID=A0A0E9W9V7_ANGAN
MRPLGKTYPLSVPTKSEACRIASLQCHCVTQAALSAVQILPMLCKCAAL